MSYVARGLGYRVNGRALLDGVDVSVHPGEVHAVLGPNGAGKTSLLKLLAGERPARSAEVSGTIELDGRTLQAHGPRGLARLRAVLPQEHGLGFAFTATQVVSLGRLPCLRHAPADEQRIVREALDLAGVLHLAARSYPTLSGGERARVQFARVMAQVWEPTDGDARFLLLDEPTASLDLAHQHDCLRAARTLAARGLGVLVILHDPNLALRYADEVTLLHGGRVLGAGVPTDVITERSLESLYGVPVRLLRTEGERLPVVVVRDPVNSAASPGRSAP